MRGVAVILLFVSSSLALPAILLDNDENIFDFHASKLYVQLLQLQSKEIDFDELYNLKNTLKVDKDKLSLVVYTQQQPTGTKISLDEAQNITKVSSFDISKRTYIYTHGWTTKYISSDGTEIRESILNVSDVNVLLYNWDYCADNIIYTTAWGCVEGVGNYLGNFLNNLSEFYGYSLDDVTLIGHSLGAHVSGYAGKTTNGAIGVIVGLDPAGPLFFENLPNNRLNRTDAKYVQVIHTSGIIIGVDYNVGIADFWPNGGQIQHGCEVYAIEFGRCSHRRSFMYYAESVLLNDFQGQICESYHDFVNDKCSSNEKGNMGGINIDRTLEGTYYLETNSQSPYGKGDI